MPQENIEDAMKHLPHSQQLAFRTALDTIKKSARGRRYDTERIITCLLLKIWSPNTYKHITQMNLLALPSAQRLQQLIKGAPCEFGFNQVVLTSIGARFADKKGLMRYGTLILNEMKIGAHKIDFKHYTLLHEADGGHQVQALPKLTKEHVDPDSLRKMNVKLAVQVSLRSTKKRTASVPDGITHQMHCDLPDEGLQLHLSEFNVIWSTGNVPGEEWKKVRNVLNPSFTTGKVKFCSEIVSRCTEELVRVLKTHHEQSEPVDLLQVAQGYSLDAITKIAMAWKVNCQQKTDDPLLIGVKRLLEDLDKAIVESSLALPGIRAVLKLLYPLTSFSNLLNRICENVRDTVKSRRQDQSLREKDMLQMMLDAQAGTEDAAYDVHKSGLLIEDRHLVSNAIVLLLAGFETTAVTLGFALYLLAMHPEEQERVHTEMEDLFSHANELTFDDVHQLKHLDMVIRETLRLYPPVPLLVARTCLSDKTVMGQFIPAGTTLIAPAWHIHRNPEYWPEPSRFLPERFAEGHPERHPMAYTFPSG
ncbi:cytochrome P450 3A4-like [Ixodes scapularis]